MERFKTIGEYEIKELLVADFVNHTDGKVDLVIVDSDWATTLFEGRQEELSWTKDGCSHELCDRSVDVFDISRDGKIKLYLNPERADGDPELLKEGV